MKDASRAIRSPQDVLAWGGLVGPAVFVCDWAVLGSKRPGYSAVADAISRLAELKAATRAKMTAGFIIYGAGLVGYGLALRSAAPGPAWLFAIGTGVATLGVAAFPLGTPFLGSVHAVFAVIGYAGLAGIPLAVAPSLARWGHPVTARLSVVAGAATALSLVASMAGGPAHGLAQRTGLTIGDLWVVLSAAQLLRRSRPR